MRINHDTRFLRIKQLHYHELEDQFEEIFDDIALNNQHYVILTEDNNTVVLVSEDYYDNIEKELHNLKYELKLAKSDLQIARGQTVDFEL